MSPPLSLLRESQAWSCPLWLQHPQGPVAVLSPGQSRAGNAEPHGPVPWDHLPRADTVPFDVTLQPQPLLWGPGLCEAHKPSGCPGRGFMPGGSSPGARLLPPDPSARCSPRRGHEAAPSDAAPGPCMGKDVRAGGQHGQRGLNLGARWVQPSPAPKCCGQNPQGIYLFIYFFGEGEEAGALVMETRCL